MAEVSGSLRVNQRELNRVMREIGNFTQDELYDAFENVRKKVKRSYAKHTVGKGKRTISRMMRATRRRGQAGEQTKRNIFLDISVDARNVKTNGGTLDGLSIDGSVEDAWNSIAVQTETGDVGIKRLTFASLKFSGRGGGRLKSSRKMMSIATDASRERKSPRNFQGKWVQGERGIALFIGTDAPGGTSQGTRHRGRMGGRRKGTRRRPTLRNVTPKILFTGHRSVATRQPEPFLKPTVLDVERAFPDIMFRALKTKLPVVRVN